MLALDCGIKTFVEILSRDGTRHKIGVRPPPE